MNQPTAILPRPPEPLADERGPIPVFGPARTDERGRVVMEEAERAARAEAALRFLRLLPSLPDDDPPDTNERLMRAIDEDRPPGRKLFDGMY